MLTNHRRQSVALGGEPLVLAGQPVDVRVRSIYATSPHLQVKHGRLGRLDKTGWV